MRPIAALRRQSKPSAAQLRADALASLTGAISSVPNGMAASVLAGVSPVHGLYAAFAGPIGGGLSTSTRLMVVTTTTAAALAAGSAIASTPEDQRANALLLLTLMAGVLMVVAGALKLGRLTRFVPHSVMIGFLSGISANIVFGQIPPLLGYDATGAFNLAKAIDALRHVSWSALPSLLTGLSAIALMALLARTRIATLAALVALIVPTIVVAALGADSVRRVDYGGAIPAGLPLPTIPRLSDVSLSLVAGAFAVTAIVLVQGAGVAESARGASSSGAPDADRDFIGQGIGNIAAGVFKGQPVGGSVNTTALVIGAGARTRWAPVLAGLWMLLILLAFSGLVGKVAMPTLSGVLIVSAFVALRPGDIATIWRASAISRVAMTTTFLATLFLPVAAAVGIGVSVALLLQLNREALDLRVVELVQAADGRLAERPAPGVLPSHAVTVLDIYGSLYYAGSRTLQSRLPDPGSSRGSAVVLRLRGRTMVGATFITVIDDYVARLRAGGGRLYLSGIDSHLWTQLTKFDRFASEPDLVLVPAESILEASTQAAYAQARSWVDAQPDDDRIEHDRRDDDPA